MIDIVNYFTNYYKNQQVVNSYLNVKNFGAVGDGINDDTVAFNEAILKASLENGTVYIPATNYNYIISGLVISSTISIVSDPNTIILLKNQSNTNMITITASNVTITGGIWDGNLTEQTVGTNRNGIYVNAVNSANISNIVIKNTTIRNTMNSFIYLQSDTSSILNNCSIINNTFNNSGKYNYVVQASGIQLTNCNYCDITGNYIKNTGNHGIYSTQGSNNKIINNSILYTGSNYNNGTAHAIFIDANSGNNPNSGHIIDSNYIENPYHGGINITDSIYNVVISNNNINTTRLVTGLSGIMCGIGNNTQGSGMNVTGNTIVGCTQSGIYFDDLVLSNITGNSISNCGQNGINNNGATGASITGNCVFNNSKSGGYSGVNLNGASVVFVGNHVSDTFNNQDYSITLDNFFSGIIDSNELTSGVSGVIFNYARANIYCHNNAGFNPLGTNIAPVVPGSTVSITNNNGVDALVYITANSGGTTSVALAGISVALIPASGVWSTLLPVNESITLTYSSTPTWTWIGN